MNLRLFVAVLALTTSSAGAWAQATNPPKSPKPAKAAPAAPVATVPAAQKVVKAISGDKAKTQIYCDIGKLGGQIEDAEQKKDMNKIDELNKRMDEMATKLGPDYVALMNSLEDIDPNSKEANDVSSALETLNKLCTK
jgi:DNA repair ATPase RecN